MSDNTVSITVTQTKHPVKLFQKVIPKLFNYTCSASYLIPNGRFESVGGTSSPLECLTDILANVEIKRTGEQIGPIHATFELLNDKKVDWYQRIKMQQLLKMYARSENTTVTFEYKE